MALLQGPQPWPPLTRMGHPAPAPAHSHLLPCPRNPMASHLGISGGKACEGSIFPRGFTSPHAVRPFASPARCEGPGLRRDAGNPLRSPPLPSSPHTAAGSSHRATEAPQRSGRHPAGREGRSGRGHDGPCGERGGTRLSRCQDGAL